MFHVDLGFVVTAEVSTWTAMVEDRESFTFIVEMVAEYNWV
jgi:hypothetical protein